VEFLDDESGILKKKVKANFKTLGPKFGKDMKAVADTIQNMHAEDLKSLEKTGNINLNGFELALSDVEILTEDIPGWLVAVEGGITVALDINISEELKQEGIARDFVNRVQNLRKESGFEVTDKIEIFLEKTDEEVVKAVTNFKSYISTEVQALKLEILEVVSEAVEVEMDEIKLKLKIVVKK
jgi:isoleucyl-tRNA synthetase